MADGILNPIEQLEADFDFDVYTKQEVDALLDEKADADSVYTKTETDALLDDKADADAVYTKTETDTLLSAKADKSTTLAGYGITDAYTKTETDTLLNGKADADDVYTKTEIDTKIPNTVGSATKPTYVNGGVLTECTYELNKTVPANAVFTDTTYSAGNGLNLSGTSFSAKASTNVTVDGNGISVVGNGTVASADSGLISGGTAYTELRPTLNGTWVKNAQTTAINLQKLEGGIEYLYGLLSHQYDQLKKYINGNYYDYQTDTDTKYTKTVLNGAMPYASLDSVGGKTLVWNQIFPSLNLTNLSCNLTAGTLTENADDSVTYTLTTASAYAYIKTNVADMPLMISGHTYYCRIDIKTPGTQVSMRINNSNNSFKTWSGLTAGTRTVLETIGAITTGETNPAKYIYPTWITGATGECILYSVTLVDLTLMYGAGNEPTSVAEFTAQFPASYYPYNAGQLLSAGVTSVVSDINLMRGVTIEQGVIGTNNGIPSPSSSRVRTASFIKVKPSTTYEFSVDTTNNPYVRVFCVYQYSTNDYSGYKGSVDQLSAKTATLTTDATTQYIKVTWNKSNNADIIPAEVVNPVITYETHPIATYPIPASIQALTGYGWSAGSVYNYVDFERKVFVQRLYGVDMGSCTWTNAGSSGYAYSTTLNGLGGIPKGKYRGALCCVNYKGITSDIIPSDKEISMGNSQSNLFLRLTDSNFANKTGAEIKTALAGQTLYYEMETPIEVDISAYLTDDNLIEVESGGTLTFPNSNGTDYQIPVPSSETYMIDLQSAI